MGRVIMKSHKLSALVLALGLMASTAQALEGDAQAGAASAAVCAACHQIDGSGMNNAVGESWPRLAGLNAEYMYKQLQDMKAGTRQSPTMMPFVTMLNDQQLIDISLYYSQLPATAGKGGESATDEQLAHGEKLAYQGDWERYIVPCKSCHGPENEGVGAEFPALAGQHAGYIADQLRKWQQGTRDNDPLHLMAAIAERLNEEDIQAVSAWLSRQPAQ